MGGSRDSRVVRHLSLRPPQPTLPRKGGGRRAAAEVSPLLQLLLILLAVIAALWVFSRAAIFLIERSSARRKARARRPDAVHVLDLPAGPDAPVLLLLHGASGNLREPVAALKAALGGRFRLVAIDRPGHGYTPRHATRHVRPRPPGRSRGSGARGAFDRPLPGARPFLGRGGRRLPGGPPSAAGRRPRARRFGHASLARRDIPTNPLLRRPVRPRLRGDRRRSAGTAARSGSRACHLPTRIRFRLATSGGSARSCRFVPRASSPVAATSPTSTPMSCGCRRAIMKSAPRPKSSPGISTAWSRRPSTPMASPATSPARASRSCPAPGTCRTGRVRPMWWRRSSACSGVSEGG